MRTWYVNLGAKVLTFFYSRKLLVISFDSSHFFFLTFAVTRVQERDEQGGSSALYPSL